MPQISTEILAADSAGIARAASLLQGGGLVAFPTETVYGLGADATDDRAVARIFDAKGRPRFNPLIVHVASIEAARRIGEFGDSARRLSDTFWPGPLTLVVPVRRDAGISDLVTAGLPTIAIRVPEHSLAQRLLARCDRPLAAPSANPSGKLSPTSAQDVLDGLSGRIEAVIDGGPCAVGLESTIVSADGEPALLRPGGLPAEIIEQCLGSALAPPHEGGAPNSPGQLASHYAPNATLRLDAPAKVGNEVFLGFGTADGDLNLSPSGDLVEAAANLFSYLRRLDTGGAGRIAVAPVPETGLGRAINDRLRRAAAPRES